MYVKQKRHTTLESKTNDLLAQIQDYLSQWRDSLNVLWTSTIKPTRACWFIKSETLDLHLNILVNIFRFVLKSVICIYTATYISKLVVLTVSAGRRQTNGYELCPSSSRFSFILIWVGVSSIRRFMRLEPLISHTVILMTFYLSIILDLQNFFHWYILQSWKLKRPQIQLRPHHFKTYTSNLTTAVNSVLKFMINGTTSILKS